MKNLKDKSERRVLGRILDAEAESQNPDMKLVRECTKKIEATAGKLSENEIEEKLAAITGSTKTVKTQTKFKKRKLWVSLVAASLAVVMISAVAASPAVWGWLSFPFTRDSGRLTEVPEGYVGIYNADDLDLIREDPDGNFILMSDIDLGGKEHTPIGDYLNPFDGKFNGNGHVISNFTITASGAAIWETVSGEEMKERWRAAMDRYNSASKRLIDAYALPAYSMFGIDGRFDDSHADVQYYDSYDLQYINAIGFFGNAGNATITGLGVENATVTVSDADYTAVGVIAGQAGYISACYVKDSTLTVNADTSEVEEYAKIPNAKVEDVFDYMKSTARELSEGYQRATVIYSISAGLLCGEVFAIDSCYTDGALNASGEGSESINYSTLSVGMIAGYGGSAVSSYSTATVNIEGNVFRSRGILGKACLVPYLMPDDVFRSLINDHMEGDYYNFDGNIEERKECKTFEKIRLISFYTEKDIEILQNPRYADIQEVEEIFFVDGTGTLNCDLFWGMTPFATRYEKLEHQYMVDKIGNIPAIEQMYRDAGMRVGSICCYTPEGKEKADYYEGFNFTDVWTMKKGMPELKIFG